MAQAGLGNGTMPGAPMPNGGPSGKTTGSPTTPSSPPVITGIAALFANQRGGMSPTMNLFKPNMFAPPPSKPVCYVILIIKNFYIEFCLYWSFILHLI